MVVCFVFKYPENRFDSKKKARNETETEGINGGRVTKMAAGGGEISFFFSFGGTHENKIRPAKNETKRVNYVFLE